MRLQGKELEKLHKILDPDHEQAEYFEEDETESSLWEGSVANNKEDEEDD